MKSAAKVIDFISQDKLKHISRFSIVGVVNTLIDFLMFTIFHGLIGLSYIVSQILGYSCGVVNSFIFNKRWTFEDAHSNKKTFHELLEFVSINLVSLIITIISMSFLVKNLALNVYLSKVIVTVIAQITNFLAYKLWVFNQGGIIK